MNDEKAFRFLFIVFVQSCNESLGYFWHAIRNAFFAIWNNRRKVSGFAFRLNNLFCFIMPRHVAFPFKLAG